MNDISIDVIVAIACAMIASSGFWAFMQNQTNRMSAEKKMLVGLAHVKIIELSMKYISRGWITKDEYHDLHHYLYKPYKDMGGDGSAERAIKEVDKLPIRSENEEHY